MANANNPGRGVSKVDVQLVSSICLLLTLFISVSKHAVICHWSSVSESFRVICYICLIN
jgi:hypothetical protein